MQSNLYIPKKIVVGFQKRADTFTGCLGFITYRDDKNLLRQEKSWNGWRDHKIDFQEFDNTPRSNFVFNKDIHRNGHWSSHSKVRIHDSRNFEFEIELSNMMYILMHSDVSKRDITEECVFAWDGRNVVLLPVNSQEYQNSVVHTKKQGMKFSFKDLVKGYTYSTKSSGDFVYLGHFEWCVKDYSSGSNMWKNTGKKHIFYSLKKHYSEYFHALNANDICEAITQDIHPSYSTFVENLHNSKHIQDIGIFSIKKGFDTIGYKKTAYDILKVTINTNQCDFSIKEVSFSIIDNKPSIKYQRDNYSNNNYDRLKRKYIKLMQEKRVDMKNIDSIKDFFVNLGFGLVQYTSTQGIKTIL